MKSNISQKGFSTIELLIAFTVATLFLTGAIMATLGTSAGNNNNGGLSRNYFGGQTIGLDAILGNQGLYDTGTIISDTVAGIVSGWGTEPASAIADTSLYSYENPTLYNSPCLALVESSASWTSEQARAQAVGFRTSVASTSVVYKMGGDCDTTIPGAWDNPDWLVRYESNIAGANSGIKGAAVDTAVIDGKLYAFLGSRHSNSSDPDFWIIDVSDPEDPQLVTGSSLDVDNGDSWPGHEMGLNDLEVVGQYVYGVRNFDRDQLQVIDISNIHNPFVVTEVPLAPYGVAIDEDPPGPVKPPDNPQAETIAYYDGLLYIGLHKTQGPELLVFDAATTPASPAIVGYIEDGFNHNIYDIHPRDGYAYLATGYYSGEIAAVKISTLDTNVLTPTNVTYINMPGDASDDRDALSITSLGNTFFVGRESSNQELRNDFFTYQMVSPTNLTLRYATNTNEKNNVGIPGIAVQGSLAFLISTDTNKAFQVWDVSDPDNIKPHGCTGLKFPANPSGIKYAQDLVFVSIEDSAFLRVIRDVTTDTVCHHPPS